MNTNLDKTKEFATPRFEWMDLIKPIKVHSIGCRRWMLADLQGNRVECWLVSENVNDPTKTFRYYGSYFKTKKEAITAWANYHKLIIKTYIDNGLPILVSILEDYPDLKKVYQEKLYQQRLKIWDGKLESITIENDNSTKITGNDLSIIVT